MKIEKFEDIEAWKEARELVKEIYDIAALDIGYIDKGVLGKIHERCFKLINLINGFIRYLKKLKP